MVILVGESKWLLLWFPGIELFMLVGLYLEDGVERAGHWTITLKETLHINYLFILLS